MSLAACRVRSCGSGDRISLGDWNSGTRPGLLRVHRSSNGATHFLCLLRFAELASNWRFWEKPAFQTLLCVRCKFIPGLIAAAGYHSVLSVNSSCGGISVGRVSIDHKSVCIMFPKWSCWCSSRQPAWGWRRTEARQKVCGIRFFSHWYSVRICVLCDNKSQPCPASLKIYSSTTSGLI